jgi:ribonuclease D
MADWIASAEALDARLSVPIPGPVALDTEFIREKTYYPQLALVQLARGDEILLLDPLTLGDANALQRVFRAPTLKLMHSPSEDLQAFKLRYGVLPRPLFDTQVAAALAGMGPGLGYQALVARLLDLNLEKGETRSDWMRRPLSPSQLHYAADDVRHLGAAYNELARRLRELGRVSWLEEECERQLATADDDAPDPHPHLGVRSAQRMPPEQQARLRRLLIWREALARRSDKPRSWIVDNELLVELALGRLTRRAEFEAALDARPRAPRRSRDELWDAVFLPLSPEERDIPLATQPDPRWREPMRRMQDAVARIAAQLDLPDGLLCARRHLETLVATGQWPNALRGWRQPLLEPALLPLLAKLGNASDASV